MAAAFAVVPAYRRLHATPELSNQELETGVLVRELAADAGLPTPRAVAGTGLMLDIKGGAPGPTIAVRAELDALPIQEATGVPWASTRDGVMHACGHDAHIAMALAAACELHSITDALPGSVRFLFEPAEEAEPLGARRMIAEGCLNGVNAVIALHVDPGLPTGTVGVRSGAYTCSSDEFEIEVTGTSAHAALPHEGVDAIAVGAAIVQALQQFVARERDPAVPLVMSIGAIHGGTAANVLADRVTMRGTIRTSDAGLRQHAQERLVTITTGVASMHRASASVEVRTGEPVVVNDAWLVALLEDVVRRRLSPQGLLAPPAWTASDDFAFYGEAAPTLYARLGVRDATAGTSHPLHHPQFQVDERALPLGAALLADLLATCLRRLEEG
jgi:amidohydrolase